MNQEENILKAIRFDRPDYIPMSYHINASCWHQYPREALWDLMEEHSFLFPDFNRSKVEKETPKSTGDEKGERHTDEWGCVWETSMKGTTGAVIEHPLDNWSKFADYQTPDPLPTTEKWKREEERHKKIQANGGVTFGGLEHGHTFLRLSDIRGYENLLMDMIDEEPRLMKLIEIVEDYNMAIVKKYLEMGVKMMRYPEDLGMQVGPMLSPDMFRKHIKPSYQRLMKPARDAGCLVHMHSDGDIRDLVDDLIDGGVQAINLQDKVNGLDWIKEKFAGKICVDLDIDRQNTTIFGTPRQIDDLIRQEVEMLGSREGGLTMIYGMYPGMPLKNAKALMDAMEKYAFHFSS